MYNNDSWVLKFDTTTPVSPSDPSTTPVPPNPLDAKLLEELLEKVSRMDEKFEALQNLLLSSHCKFDTVAESIEKIRASSKETGTDVAMIQLKLEQVVKDAAKFV